MLSRPLPPSRLSDEGRMVTRFEPAEDLAEWVMRAIIDEDGPLANPAHQHLRTASIGFLWTNAPNFRGGHAVAGMTEKPICQGNRWQKARHDLQLSAWFPRNLDFLITLDAVFAAENPDVNFCALVEHELYHIAHAKDQFRIKKFSKSTGKPILALRGHDVEEFVGVAERYGAGACAGATAELVRVSNLPPLIGEASIRAACGNCLRMV
ncbi:hypothetical protein CCAX7_54760 [Capsulimonas corticalis]|uniref:Putative phage metallopeptidase domain-containing protein n=2 Tax=Capsulimonas corticalis TaxID=2219043 RepID=A0A402D5Q4_9BACT|nr:hypothetical protein CCAX7_54760 [Capsulimonas corticalis]